MAATQNVLNDLWQWFDITPKEIPTVLTIELNFDFSIYMLEVANSNPSMDGTITVYDQQSPTPLILLPSATTVFKGGLMTYKADHSRRMDGGMAWVASIPGMIGYLVGCRIGVRRTV